MSYNYIAEYGHIVYRLLYRKWRKPWLLVDENAFKRQKNRVNALLNAFSIKYNSDIVKKNANNPKSLFRIINRLLHRKEESPKPPHTSESDLANEFSTFFTQKIHSIHDYHDNPQGDFQSQNCLARWTEIQYPAFWIQITHWGWS